MAKFELNPTITRKGFKLRQSDKYNTFTLNGNFELPRGQRALIGIDKSVVSQCPKGFTESPGGFYYIYLWGSGEEESIDLEFYVDEDLKNDLPMFVRLWESNGPFIMELEQVILPKQIAILGGCCTRDTFELETFVDVSEYRARTSFASLASPGAAYLPDSVLERIPSSFQRRMVRGDLLKESLRSVVLSEGKHVIVDFLIERTPIFYAGQVIVTKSHEFGKLGLSEEELPGAWRAIDGNSVEYFELFARGWKHAAQGIMTAGKKVYVNAIRWATHNELGEEFDRDWVRAENRRLEYLYQIVEQVTPNVEWIRYTDDLLVADSNHKWGQSPFHFGRPFYESQRQQIEEFVKSN